MADDFIIRIGATDDATAIVEKVKTALGKITEPIDKSQKGVAKLGAAGRGGLEKLEKGLDGVARSASAVVDRIVAIIPGLTALSGVASLAGLSALVERTGSFGFKLGQTSRLLGMNAQELAQWHVAARRAGITAESLDQSMSGAQQVLRDTASGRNPPVMNLLLSMGVDTKSIFNANGTVRDYGKAVAAVMSSIGRIKSPQAQFAAAGQVGMGAMLPMIQQGTYGTDRKDAITKGLVPTPDEQRRMDLLWHDIENLKESVEGLGIRIGSALMPVLDPLITSLSKWLDQHRVDIANAMSDAVGKFVNWIKGIDWDAVTKKITGFWDAIGGVQGVLIGIAALTLAGPITSVLGLVTALTTLTSTAIPAAVTGIAGISLAGVAAMAALAIGAGVAIKAIKDSTEPGHFVPRNAGGKLPPSLRTEDTNAAWLAREVDAAKNFFKPGGGRFVSRTSTDAHGSTSGLAPLGIRSNNPLNMLTKNVENVYATPEEGIAAAAANLRRGYRDLTLAQIADKWTGGARTGNTPQQMASYVGILSKGTGLAANQMPDLNDPAVVAALMKAQIRAENGIQPYTDAQINAGVRGGAGAGLGGTAAAPQDDGHNARVASLQQQAAPIIVNVNNALPGTRVEAQTADGGYMPTRINYAMGVAP